MTNDNNHEPLHDREAERAVLGAMLIDTDVIPCIPSARSKPFRDDPCMLFFDKTVSQV